MDSASPTEFPTEPPTESLTDRKRTRARARIVAAAEALFAEAGFAAVSVSDIATRAEVGRTTFFRYFGDKQEVVFAQEEEFVATIAAAHGRSDIPPPRDLDAAVEQLRVLVVELCALATADRASYRRHAVLVEDHLELRARDALKLQQFAELLRQVLVDRGTEERTATLAAHLAIACYQAARRGRPDPAALVADTDAAFARLSAVGRSDAPAPHGS